MIFLICYAHSEILYLYAFDDLVSQSVSQCEYVFLCVFACLCVSYIYIEYSEGIRMIHVGFRSTTTRLYVCDGGRAIGLIIIPMHSARAAEAGLGHVVAHMLPARPRSACAWRLLNLRVDLTSYKRFELKYGATAQLSHCVLPSDGLFYILRAKVELCTIRFRKYHTYIYIIVNARVRLAGVETYFDV